jgi:hypothetical protein
MITPKKIKPEQEWALQHKPTKKWVHFKAGQDDQNLVEILLVKDPDFASLHPDPKKLQHLLRYASFAKSPRYGEENFLEFEPICNP